MKTGWIKNSNYEYHSGPGLSSSEIVKIFRSPKHYRYADNEISAETANFGSAVHAAILEPECNNIVFLPSIPYKTTKAFREKWFEHYQEWHQMNILRITPEEAIQLKKDEIYAAFLEDVYPIRYKDKAKIFGMQKSVFDKYSELLDGYKEISGYLNTSDDFNNQLLKCRPDIRKDDTIIDIKTCEDARRYNEYIRKYLYFVKASWYMDIANGIAGENLYKTFIWIFIEKTSPYDCIAVEMPKEMKTEGTKIGKSALHKYSHCLERDTWPGYDESIRIAKFPKWYWNEAI